MSTKPPREIAELGKKQEDIRPSFDLSQQRWNEELEKNAHRPLHDSPVGRAQIRLFSRGVLGAAAFAWGGWYARRATGLAGYSPENWNKAKPLHWIAKFFDTFAGKPIKAAANALGYDGERIVRFRTFDCEFSPNIAGRAVGRPLGEEVVGITFDFAMASIGDALGRDIADMLDPNVKKDWIHPGGSIDINKAIKGSTKAAFRYITYNQGEDWAVGLPYAYWMKATRSLWNKAYPGFKHDFDRGLNGGSFMMDPTGTKVIGNYQMAGILNLWERFTAYNIGTLMYRELYNGIDAYFHGKSSPLYGDPSKSGPLLADAGEGLKWAARSAIKGSAYMIPATPFFWITRVPQSKYKGRFIRPDDRSIMCYNDGTRYAPVETHRKVTADGIVPFTPETPVQYRRLTRDRRQWLDGVTHHPYDHPIAQGFKAYGETFGPIDTVLNEVGKASNAVRKKLHHVPGALGMQLEPGQFQAYKRISDRYWNAAVAYTPYMWAKAEGALWVDRPETDYAAEEIVDGVASLNWGKFKMGCSDFMRALAHQPFEDPIREQEAQKRVEHDTSPPDDFLPYQTVRRSFAQRIRPGSVLITGQQPKGGDGASAGPQPQRQARFTDQLAMEELKKMEDLQNLAPPTPSLH